MPPPLPVAFSAGEAGPWRVERVVTVAGEGLPGAPRLAVTEGPGEAPPATWTLHGVTSNARYTTRPEMSGLAAMQEGLARPAATRAALIPIRKSEAWWNLTQDERRAVLEEQSRHIAIGMEYLPAVARRLHHCRDLGEPFDFLTWFEFAPEHEADFDAMLKRLRATPEWGFVEREVEVRLTRDGARAA